MRVSIWGRFFPGWIFFQIFRLVRFFRISLALDKFLISSWPVIDIDWIFSSLLSWYEGFILGKLMASFLGVIERVWFSTCSWCPSDGHQQMCCSIIRRFFFRWRFWGGWCRWVFDWQFCDVFLWPGFFNTAEPLWIRRRIFLDQLVGGRFYVFLCWIFCCCRWSFFDSVFLSTSEYGCPRLIFGSLIYFWTCIFNIGWWSFGFVAVILIKRDVHCS